MKSKRIYSPLYPSCIYSEQFLKKSFTFSKSLFFLLTQCFFAVIMIKKEKL